MSGQVTYTLSDFGSYTAGGRTHHVTDGKPRTVQFRARCPMTSTRAAPSRSSTPTSSITCLRHAIRHPPLFWSTAAGMCGSCWETTPDGRPGWLHLLLQQGYEVHVLDNVERGRAGFVPGLWEGGPVLRSIEEAWTLMRIGDTENFAARRPFEGQKFPVDSLEALARRFVPRWFSTTGLQAAALRAVLARTGPATVICHSQGSEAVFDALSADPQLAVAVVALEPSSDHDPRGPLADLPMVLVSGGFLDTTEFWQARRAAWRQSARNTRGRTGLLETDAEIGPGHSHMLMMDRDNDMLLDLCLARLSAP